MQSKTVSTVAENNNLADTCREHGTQLTTPTASDVRGPRGSRIQITTFQYVPLAIGQTGLSKVLAIMLNELEGKFTDSLLADCLVRFGSTLLVFKVALDLLTKQKHISTAKDHTAKYCRHSPLQSWSRGWTLRTIQ